MGVMHFLLVISLVLIGAGVIHAEGCDATACSLASLTGDDQDLIPSPNQTCYEDSANVTISCAAGTGNLTDPTGSWMCQNGSWSPPSSPRCEFPCDVPTISNGNLSPPISVLSGANVTVECDPGYALEAGVSSTITCVHGSLDAAIPTCSASCAVPNINNGNLTSVGPFLVEDNATVRCFNGHDLEDGVPPTVTCGVNSTWGAEFPDCYGRCDVHGVPNSDKPDASQIEHGSGLTIECDSGYSYEDETTFPVTCEDGTIEGTLPDQCDEDNGSLSGHRLDMGPMVLALITALIFAKGHASN